jgi:lysozyme
MILQVGSRTADVAALQLLLRKAGFEPGPFQTSHAIAADGTVDWPYGATAQALGAPPPPHAAAPATSPPVTGVPDEAVAIGENFEGFSAVPYWDPAACIWTYGFGSTRDPDNHPVAKTTPPVTRAQGLVLMRRDLAAGMTEIAADVHVPLTAAETAALDDFIYNVGAGNFRASTLLRKLNAGDRAGAADQFVAWDRAGGVVLAGLLRRREAERAEFLKA